MHRSHASAGSKAVHYLYYIAASYLIALLSQEKLLQAEDSTEESKTKFEISGSVSNDAAGILFFIFSNKIY
jgi:hypothetical protein